jgi:vitamin B12 transporter
MRIRVPLIIALSVIPPSALWALEFTVCAKKWETDLENTMKATEIDTTQYRTADSLLETFPGIIVKNQGGTSRISIRGAKTDQTLVLINGITMNDPSDPNDAFDFSTIETEDIADIKIITGAEALEYGSSAIGGVIAITTKKGCGPLKMKGRVEHGSSKTTNATASIKGEENEISYYINAVGKRMGRGSRYNPLHGNDVSNFDKDINAETRLGTNIQENWQIELYAHGDRHDLNIDDLPLNGLPKKIGDCARKKSDLIVLKNQVSMLDKCWLHTLDISHMDMIRHYWYPLEDKTLHIDGERNYLKYESTYKTSDCFKLLAETGWQQDQAKTGDLDKSLDHSYGKLKAEGLTTDHQCFTLAGRIDKTEKVRPHKTVQATATFRLIPTMLFKTNAGTGFRTPSIQDIFGFPPFQIPNFNLKPEESKNFEMGIENKFADGILKTSLTAYYTRIHNIIVWDSQLKQMVNRNRRVSKGIEAKTVFNPAQEWCIVSSYSFTHARDSSPKRTVVEQPKHKVTLNVNFQASCDLQFFTGIIYESSRQSWTFLNCFKLPATTDVRVGSNYLITEDITIFGRIENLLNQKREKIYGYGRNRRGMFVGIKLMT